MLQPWPERHLGRKSSTIRRTFKNPQSRKAAPAQGETARLLPCSHPEEGLRVCGGQEEREGAWERRVGMERKERKRPAGRKEMGGGSKERMQEPVKAAVGGGGWVGGWEGLPAGSPCRFPNRGLAFGNWASTGLCGLPS